MIAIRALSSVFAVLFLVLGAYVLDQSRSDVREQRMSSDANLVRAVAADVARNFNLIDLALAKAQDEIESSDNAALAPGLRRKILFGASAGASYLSHIARMDERGHITEDSALDKLPTTDYSDREYFRVHAVSANVGIYIGHPIQSRLAGGEYVIALSRRLSNADGSFRGVVVAFIDIQYFGSLIDNLRLGSTDSIAFFQEDGTIILRQPFRINDIGKNLLSADLFKYFPSSNAGVFESNSAATDNIPRMFSFSRAGNLPIVVSIGATTASVYAPWRQRALMIGAILVSLTLSMAGLGLLLARELRRRSDAEKQMRSLAGQLALAASTDALTGIPNRRKFQDVAAVEWRRMQRSRAHLALLLIDVDVFKQLNDQLGHDQGDEALKAVANCIAGCLRRSGDFCARVGGEEFAVILPLTQLQGAHTVAERLRMSVKTLKINHPSGIDGVLTVSIGACSCVPCPEGSFPELYRSADTALYTAKTLGRDRSEVIDCSGSASPNRSPLSRHARVDARSANSAS